MADRYHINPETGRANKCTAAAGNCRFGADTAHDATKEQARVRYEKQMARELMPEPAKKEATAGEIAMAPYLTYLKERINKQGSSGEQAKADYSRAIAFSRSNKAPTEVTAKGITLDSYVNYLKERLQPKGPGRHYKVQEAAQAEYSRLVAFARKHQLTSR